jgi:SHS2 domain-containing protein
MRDVMPYRYVEEIATADVAFEAWAATVEEVFVAACDATMNVMVHDLESIAAREQRPLRAEAEARDMLLFALLQELIYFKDAEQLLLRVSQVRIEPGPSGWVLDADSYGESIDRQKHDLIVDVKAVTLHRFQLQQVPEGWRASVILDI